MNATQLSRRFIRVRDSGEHKTIQVLRITWYEPSRPTSYWRTVVRLPPSASATAVVKARRALLKNPKHFGVCAECGERNPQGWMHDEALCQSCAEANHGVVH